MLIKLFVLFCFFAVMIGVGIACRRSARDVALRQLCLYS